MFAISIMFTVSPSKVVIGRPVLGFLGPVGVDFLFFKDLTFRASEVRALSVLAPLYFKAFAFVGAMSANGGLAAGTDEVLLCEEVSVCVLAGAGLATGADLTTGAAGAAGVADL